MTRWPRNAARSSPSTSQRRQRWSGSITPRELPRDGSPFAESPETVTHVSFLARWVWLPIALAALFIVLGNRQAAPPPAKCQIDLSDYTSL